MIFCLNHSINLLYFFLVIQIGRLSRVWIPLSIYQEMKWNNFKNMCKSQRWLLFAQMAWIRFAHHMNRRAITYGNCYRTISTSLKKKKIIIKAKKIPQKERLVTNKFHFIALTITFTKLNLFKNHVLFHPHTKIFHRTIPYRYWRAYHFKSTLNTVSRMSFYLQRFKEIRFSFLGNVFFLSS